MKALYINEDITQNEIPKKAVERYVAELGSVGILVNCACICICEEVTKFGRKEWDKIIAINLTAVFEMSHKCEKYMIKQRSGKIINICSLFSFIGGQLSPAYVSESSTQDPERNK